MMRRNKWEWKDWALLMTINLIVILAAANALFAMLGAEL